MNIAKVMMGAGVAIGLLSSTVAMAADTRSSAAMPASAALAPLPVNGIRTMPTLKKKSQLAEGTSSGVLIAGGVAAAAVIAGIVVVATDNNNNKNNPSSPG